MLPGPRELSGEGTGVQRSSSPGQKQLCACSSGSLAHFCDGLWCPPAQRSHRILSLHAVGLGWGPAGAWLSLSGVSALVLGSATSPLAGGPAAAGALAFHLLLVLAQWYVSAPVRALPAPPQPRAGRVMALAEPRGPAEHVLPRLNIGCHPCATDLGCTSPSLSVQSPILPSLSSSPLENDLVSPAELPAAPAHELQPTLMGSPTGTSPGGARHVHPTRAADCSLCSRCALTGPLPAWGLELPGQGVEGAHRAWGHS